MQSYLEPLASNFFEVASLSIAAGALMYAALAFRIAKQALVAAERSDLAALKLKAQEGRARAERSYLSLQAACHEVRRQWDLHHDRHFPKLGSPGFRRDDTHHILEVESEGRELLRPLEPEMGGLDSDGLESYIQLADRTSVAIERLTFRLSPPKALYN